MSVKATTLALINLVVFNVGLIALMNKPERAEPIVQAPIVQQFTPIPVRPEPIQHNYNLSDPFPSYLSYDRTVAKIKEWNREAPDITEVGTYGKSSRGKDIYYIRIHGDNGEDDVKPKVMITACIHGNEPLSASTVMGYIGTILDKYGDDEKITELVNTRDLYFVPVVSPDSYPNSRHVDGVDPNRNFPTQRDPDKRSVPPIQALREFFLKVRPNAVISGHTWGRVYLTPWGDQTRRCPNDADYDRIIGKMGELSNYRFQRACEMYSRPIYGTEVDWYYRNGAFSSSQNGEIHAGAFSIVMEMGTHQRIPTMQEIKTEFDMTFRAVLHFIKEAPLVEIWWKGDQPVNRDGSPKIFRNTHTHTLHTGEGGKCQAVWCLSMERMCHVKHSVVIVGVKFVVVHLLLHRPKKLLHHLYHQAEQIIILQKRQLV